jgi:hypothetical protein
MANSVDRLFEKVLAQLPDLEIDEDTSWPDISNETEDVLDNPPDDDDEGRLYPYREIISRDRDFDKITGGITVPRVHEEDKELLDGGIRSRGFEAIAFYKSKRFQKQKPFVGKWGIFYINEGLTHVAWLISQTYPGYADPRTLARALLRAHEHFHFRADLTTLMLEATLGKHLYIPVRRRFRRARTYFVEESIANRQAYDWAKQERIGIEEFARDFMLCQPNAYARFLEPIADLTGEWMANVVDAQPPRCPPRNDLAPWVTSTPKEFLRQSVCPEWVIYPRSLSNWINPACITPPVKEVSEGDKFLKVINGKLRSLQRPWEKTKSHLLINKDLPGLNFKPWKKDGPRRYSVKIDDGNRAHLENCGDGKWLAYAIGSHTDLGHD